MQVAVPAAVPCRSRGTARRAPTAALIVGAGPLGPAGLVINRL